MPQNSTNTYSLKCILIKISSSKKSNLISSKINFEFLMNLVLRLSVTELQKYLRNQEVFSGIKKILSDFIP